jgi:hypothetical protein
MSLPIVFTNEFGTVDVSKLDTNFNYLDTLLLGSGQTWTNLTASRSAGVSYQNTTGKPIQVNISTYNLSNSAVGNLTVSGVIVAQTGSNGAPTTIGVTGTLSAIVPPNASYIFSISGNVSINYWAELR